MSKNLWFEPQSLQPLCESSAWARGNVLYRENKARNLSLKQDDDHWGLEGEVMASGQQDSAPFRVSIGLALMPDGEVDYWSSECNCVVGSQCQHGVALMLQAAYDGIKLGGTLPPEEPVVEKLPLKKNSKAEPSALDESTSIFAISPLAKNKGLVTGSPAEPAPPANGKSPALAQVASVLAELDDDDTTADFIPVEFHHAPVPDLLAAALAPPSRSAASAASHAVPKPAAGGWPGMESLVSSASGPESAALSPKSSTKKVSVKESAFSMASSPAGQASLMQWLQALDSAAAHAGDNSDHSAPVDPDDRPEQYLFLLSVIGPPRNLPQMQLQAVVSYRKLTGGWAKPQMIRTQPAKGQALYDRATDTERQVLQLLRAMPHNQSYYSAYSGAPCALLDGQLGLWALEQASRTGRLFLDGDGAVGAPLQWGPQFTLEWQWQNGADDEGDDEEPEEEAPTDADGNTVAEAPWTLRPHVKELELLQATLCWNHPPMYLDLEHGRCGGLQPQGLSYEQIRALLKCPPLPGRSLQKFQHALAQTWGALPADMPWPPMAQPLNNLTGIAPRACLFLAPTPTEDVPAQGPIMAKLEWDYDGHFGYWPPHARHVWLLEDMFDADPAGNDDEAPVRLQRDLEAEHVWLDKLAAWGLAPDAQGYCRLLESSLMSVGAVAAPDWLTWADTDYDELRKAGFDIQLDDRLLGWISHADTLEVDMHAAGGKSKNKNGDGAEMSPWFDISLGIEVQGERHNILPWLPQWLAAAAVQTRAFNAADPTAASSGTLALPAYVYLPRPEGGFVRLPSAALQPWISTLLEWVSERPADMAKGQVRLSRLEALSTAAALGEETGAEAKEGPEAEVLEGDSPWPVHWHADAGLRNMVSQLRGTTALPEVVVPDSVKAELRPYQMQGLQWLQFLRMHGLGGILADDMGLGKTLQTLAHLQMEKTGGRLIHPALIVAPVSLLGNWQREAARFCPDLRTLVLHGKDRHSVAESLVDFDVVIAPYSLLSRDRDRWLQTPWHVVVLDEAQNIKNSSTGAAQVASELKALHRVCLSGTPMENHLGEIWSLFNFAMPGFLGTQSRFKKYFRQPIEKLGDAERMAQLRQRVAPFMLRRTKSVVAGELPPKIETVVRVDLEGAQADLYETIRLGMEKTVREALSRQGMAKSQITILDALLKLRQVCCDPTLVPLEAAQNVHNSAKLEHLMELLPALLADGRKILLFSQFTSMLARIEVELKKKGLKWVKLTGQSENRDALIDQFTSGEVPLFLISLKAGGVGLNLPQADTVIHYDPWWNPAAEAQATDRAHRIGQTQSVWVMKLVAHNTIEERILAMQERKAALANNMYQSANGDSVAAGPLALTEQDLSELFRPLSD